MTYAATPAMYANWGQRVGCYLIDIIPVVIIGIIGSATRNVIIALGTGLAFARDICHILDSLACYIGWLFPIWDAKRQTFADKIISTVVVPA